MNLLVKNNTAILESLLSQGGADKFPGNKQYSYKAILESLLSQGGADRV